MSDTNELDLSTPENITRFTAYFKEKFGQIAFSLLIDPTLKITPTSSRIGGFPYWNFSRPYPCNEKHEALRFMCQINLAELPAYQHLLKEHTLPSKAAANADALPKQGLLQFFAAPTDTYGCTFEANNSDFSIVYWQDASAIANIDANATKIIETTDSEAVESKKNAVVYSIPEADLQLTMEKLRNRLTEHGLDEKRISNLFMKNSDYSWPIDHECGLRFVAGIDLPHFGDSEIFDDCMSETLQAVFDIDIDDEDNDSLFDYMDQLSDSDEYTQQLEELLGLTKNDNNKVAGSLLGYPDFTQDNPLTYMGNLADFDTLLIRLDTVYTPRDRKNNNFEMMWGDCGIANVFINEEKLKALNFGESFYTWDCC